MLDGREVDAILSVRVASVERLELQRWRKKSQQLAFVYRAWTRSLAAMLACLTVLSAAAAALPPPDGVELIQRRTRTAKHFALPDGRSFAVIAAAPVHYQDLNGAWQDIDLAFHRDSAGDDLADRNVFVVRSDAWGLTLTDWWGRGVLWLMPQRPVVDGSSASVANEGVVWNYVLTPTALKAEALVTASRGPQTYRFLYYTIGGADEFTVDADGNAVIAEVAVVPRAFAAGANGVTYSAGTWEVSGEGTLQFAFDDSSLPAEAYPYRLDPTTQSGTVNAGYVYGRANTYTSARSTSYYSHAGSGVSASPVGQEYIANSYSVYRPFLEFDTGSIPGDAAISEAKLQLAVSTGPSVAGFSVKISDVDWSVPLDSSQEVNYDDCLAAPVDAEWLDTSEPFPLHTYLPSQPLSPTWVRKGGQARTRYCLRSSDDLAASEPVPGGPPNYVGAYLYVSNQSQPPLLEVTYTAPRIAYFDGAEAGSNGVGIDSAAQDCLGYKSTNCGNGAQCVWTNAQFRSGDLALRFDSGSGTQTPNLTASIADPGNEQQWLQACVFVPSGFPAVSGGVAIARTDAPTSPRLVIDDVGSPNFFRLHGKWGSGGGAVDFSSEELSTNAWHCGVIGFRRESAADANDGHFELWVDRRHFGSSDSVSGTGGSSSEIVYGLLTSLATANRSLYLDDVIFAEGSSTETGAAVPRLQDWKIEVGSAPTEDTGSGWTSFAFGCSSRSNCTDERPFTDGNSTYMRSNDAGQWGAVHNSSYGFSALAANQSVAAAGVAGCLAKQPAAQPCEAAYSCAETTTAPMSSAKAPPSRSPSAPTACGSS